jgi:2-polyprenyl-3-methyl-5-hydroxy-6-metoxy-1,4-benzoquinol methylase
MPLLDSQDSNGNAPMTDVPDRATFENLYAGKAPWDIGKPQRAFIDVADQISGSILDAGCGTGDTALFLASRGNTVTGIDFLEEPIKRAKRKAAERGLSVTFLVSDALTLKDWNERFDNVIICEVELRGRFINHVGRKYQYRKSDQPNRPLFAVLDLLGR